MARFYHYSCKKIAKRLTFVSYKRIKNEWLLNLCVRLVMLLPFAYRYHVSRLGDNAAHLVNKQNNIREVQQFLCILLKLDIYMNLLRVFMLRFCTMSTIQAMYFRIFVKLHNTDNANI